MLRAGALATGLLALSSLTFVGPTSAQAPTQSSSGTATNARPPDDEDSALSPCCTVQPTEPDTFVGPPCCDVKVRYTWAARLLRSLAVEPSASKGFAVVILRGPANVNALAVCQYVRTYRRFSEHYSYDQIYGEWIYHVHPVYWPTAPDKAFISASADCTRLLSVYDYVLTASAPNEARRHGGGPYIFLFKSQADFRNGFDTYAVLFDFSKTNEQETEQNLDQFSALVATPVSEWPNHQIVGVTLGQKFVRFFERVGTLVSIVDKFWPKS